jgi:hypothetical protein
MTTKNHYFNELMLKGIKRFTEDSVKLPIKVEDFDNLSVEHREVMLDVTNHIIHSIAQSIPTFLRLTLANGDSSATPSLTIGPFTYEISQRESGDNIVFQPSFSSTDTAGEYWPVHLFEKPVHDMVNEQLIDIFADVLFERDDYLNVLRNYLDFKVFDPATEEWIQNDPIVEGLQYNLDDLAVIVSVYACTICFLLVSENTSEAHKLPLPEGTYVLEGIVPGDAGESMKIAFVPSKEYKMAIKNDELALELTEEAE